MHRHESTCTWCGQAIAVADPGQGEPWLCPECDLQYAADAEPGLPPGPKEPYVD